MSDTCTVNVNLPVDPDGVPVIAPVGPFAVVGARLRPPGSAPLVTDQVYGAVPPVVVMLAVCAVNGYAMPSVAAGRAALLAGVRIDTARAMTTLL